MKDFHSDLVLAHSNFRTGKYGEYAVEDVKIVDHINDANLVTSRYKDSLTDHALLLDLDVPHNYVPSSTPGHGHLLIGVRLPYSQWVAAMEGLSKAGVLESGFVSASKGKRIFLSETAVDSKMNTTKDTVAADWVIFGVNISGKTVLLVSKEMNFFELRTVYEQSTWKNFYSDAKIEANFNMKTYTIYSGKTYAEALTRLLNDNPPF